ncbi:phage tail protein [Salmonella enterica]|nr:phage tail protein [Salmonella enterica]EBN9407202.1 phage tail protein [Salmonella enterica]EDA1160329.1 phage tail protein [Salmonella enterica]EHN4675112.1 tail fiber protein [Salmonella enterica]
MFHLDNNSGISAMPKPAAQQSSATRWFTEGGGNNSPSWPGQDWFNIVQAELLNVLTTAGIAPEKTAFNQLALAIKAIINKDALLKGNLLSEIRAAGASSQKTARENLDITDATLNKKGLTQLSNAVDSTSEAQSATPKAVKTAMDNANARLAKDRNGADIPNVALFLQNVGLEETINLAKNAVPVTRRINSKPLTGDITLSAADVNAFALGMTGDYTLENDKSVGWNWKSGVYNVPTGGASRLILHFNMNIGSCPAVQFCVNYKNGGISYRSARDDFGFELDWTEFYTTTRKPSAGDVGALPVSGGVINGNLGIGTPNILGGSSIVLGDNDTGLKQNGDGLLDIYANGVQVFRFQNDTLESKKSINVTGRLTPTDYGNFDSRYVQDFRLGSYESGQAWMGPGFSDTPGYVLTAATNGNGDELIDGLGRRPMQKLIGNQWYNVTSV